MIAFLKTIRQFFTHKHQFITRTFLYDTNETVYDEFCRCGEVRMRSEKVE